MNAPFIVSTAAVLAGQLLIASPLAAQLAGAGIAPPEMHRLTPDLMLVQGAQPLEAASDRMTRLRQNRAVLENALRAPQEPAPALPSTDIQPEQGLTAEAQELVSCEAAAAIVADYGFSDIRATDCAGELYRFSATRDGTAYSIGITAAAGEIAEVSRQ